LGTVAQHLKLLVKGLFVVKGPEVIVYLIRWKEIKGCNCDEFIIHQQRVTREVHLDQRSDDNNLHVIDHAPNLVKRSLKHNIHNAISNKH
jgi:hypothetical protein